MMIGLPYRAARTLFAVTVFAACFASGAARAESEAPCSARLVGKLVIAGTVPKVCETSTRLVPGRAVVLALWDLDPDSPPRIPFAAVLDERALESGRQEFLYKHPAAGQSFAPYLFNGKTVTAAIADFDGSGRMGWGMMVIPDADYHFAITAYDAKTGKFVDIAPAGVPAFVANDLDAMVRVTNGQILIPVCVASGSAFDLYFDVYRLAGGRYIRGPHILATAASPAERTKCRQSGP